MYIIKVFYDLVRIANIICDMLFENVKVIVSVTFLFFFLIVFYFRYIADNRLIH